MRTQRKAASRQKTQQNLRRHYSASVDFRRRLGAPVRRVALDAGIFGGGCPNRDAGGRGGCVFCNPAGSGTGAAARGLSLARQWQATTSRPTKRGPAPLYMAYLQAHTATYGPPERLDNLLDQLADLPGASLASISARPDCLPEQTLALLADYRLRLPTRELWLDMGLQSACDATLTRIGRGHSFAQFALACGQAAERGLRVCVHLMAGLPGETPEDFLASVRAVSDLPIAGVKLHNCLVVQGARLEELWRQGGYETQSRETYVDLAVNALELLPARVAVHRLQADAKPGELLAPDWAPDKHGLIEAIRRGLAAQNTWQGRLRDARDHIPPWFAMPSGPTP